MRTDGRFLDYLRLPGAFLGRTGETGERNRATDEQY